MTPLPEALPTPYDLKPIPYFAWEPGTAAWIVAAAAALIALLIAARRTRRRTPFPALRRAVTELDSLLAELDRNGEGRTSLARASLVARRALSAAGEIDVAPLTAAELRDLASRDRASPLYDLYLAAAELDAPRFEPELPRERARELLAAMRNKMERSLSSPC